MNEAPHLPGAIGSDEPHAVIRELRIKVGLLQSELEHLRHDHAALQAAIASDVATLARRYLEPSTCAAHEVRALDCSTFGGPRRGEGAEQRPASEAPDGAREHRRA